MSEYTLEMWLIVYGAALFDSFCMLSGVVAFQYDRAGFAGLISYVIIVYSFMCDIIVFQETLSWLEIVSAIVILLTAFGITFYKMMQKKRKTEPEPKA